MTTKQLPNGVAFDLSGLIVGLERQTGRAVLVERSSSGPWRIDGYTIESSALGGPPRHGGELHPDADELQLINVTPGPGGRVRPLPED
jgi:hypothetical protein